MNEDWAEVAREVVTEMRRLAGFVDRDLRSSLQGLTTLRVGKPA
jgi:hypothetical protein